MVISTVHEKSMHKFAQSTESCEKLHNPVIHISRNRNDETATVQSSRISYGYLNHKTQLT